jgi:hypothetical protein
VGPATLENEMARGLATRALYIYIYITSPEPLPIYRDCRLQRLPPAAKTLASLDRGKLKNPRWFRNQFCKYSSSSWFVRLIPPKPAYFSHAQDSRAKAGLFFVGFRSLRRLRRDMGYRAALRFGNASGRGCKLVPLQPGYRKF